MNKQLWQSNVNNTATKEYMNLLHSIREGILGHVMLFNAMSDTIKCIHKFLQTSRVDRRRAKTNVHTLVVNPSMILTSTLVPGVHWMIRFNSVSFRDSRPSFQSMVHGRYGHTTGYDPFRRYGLMIMSIGNSIKDTSSTRILIKHGSIRGSSRTICCLTKYGSI